MNKKWRSVQNRAPGGRNMAQPSSAGELNAVDLETGLLEQWATEKTFQSSIDGRRNNAPFIFLEGTADGQRETRNSPCGRSHLQGPRMLLEGHGGLLGRAKRRLRTPTASRGN